ncbi:unnamed protein product [Symbiodinium microadriaticum]|nr:unnamed protein product [Symbiodinium microadriaticum]
MSAQPLRAAPEINGVDPNHGQGATANGDYDLNVGRHDGVFDSEIRDTFSYSTRGTTVQVEVTGKTSAIFAAATNIAEEQNQALKIELDETQRSVGATGLGSTTTRFTFGQETGTQRNAPEQTPIAPAPPPIPESRGFLRSFLGPTRLRGDTPPPPRAPMQAAQESPMMDALMKGVQQLQELQAAALAKGQNLAAEVVKPGTTVLSPLPSTVHGAESALLFQDWLEVTSAVMRDVSEQSGVWWEAVLQEVERAYKVWLAATPLERLNVLPGLKMLTSKWVDGSPDVAFRTSMLRTKGTTQGDFIDYKLFSSVSTTATTGASDTLSSTGSTVQGVPWTLETLIQAAQQVVHPPQGEVGREVSPEKTKPEMRVLHLRDLRVCSMSRSTTALVDSGATHSLRAAASPTEWEKAEEVVVQLAGSHQLVMRITASGTLLMPHRSSPDDPQKSSSLHPQTIVPMGQLISTLGYTMVWGPEGCVLTSPDGQALRLNVEAGCPQLCEMEALSLIARLEERKLEQLSNAAITTKDKIEVAAMATEQSWHSYLYDYVANGAFESGLRAIRDTPMFEDLPGECLTNLVPAAGLWSGWDIMKNIGFLTRAQRRRFLTSKRWVVHLFAGTEGHWEIMKLDQGDTVVLELDKDRCAGQDLMRNEVWRMLLWGAKEGKIDVIIGGPPGRYQQYAKGGQRDPKYLTLIARMMWLYAVAQVGREINGGSREKNRDVGFVLEYPEGTPQSVRDERLRAIDEAEDMLRRPGERAGVASWDETRFFWEHVQRPRWELQVGYSTVDGRSSFWDTRLWKEFQKEFQMRTVSFDQGAMGASAKNPTTLGTNVVGGATGP